MQRLRGDYRQGKVHTHQNGSQKHSCLMGSPDRKDVLGYHRESKCSYTIRSSRAGELALRPEVYTTGRISTESFLRKHGRTQGGRYPPTRAPARVSVRDRSTAGAQAGSKRVVRRVEAYALLPRFDGASGRAPCCARSIWKPSTSLPGANKGLLPIRIAGRLV